MARRLTLKQHLEDAELRVQRARIARQLRLSLTTLCMPLNVKPKDIPRCSTRPSDCRRVTVPSSTLSGPMSPSLAIWINVVASSWLSSTDGLCSMVLPNVYLAG
jgi:hypothetical protein